MHGMASLALPRPQGRFHDLPLAIKSIAGFWLFYLFTIVLRTVTLGTGEHDATGRRVIGVLVGLVLTFLVYAIIRMFAARGSLRRLIVVAALSCIPAALIFAAFNFTMFFLHNPLMAEKVTQKGTDGTMISRTPGGQISVQRPGEKEQVIAQALPVRQELMKQAPRALADSTVTWYFLFAAWASFYVALSSANQLRLAERRASEFERAAQSAQLRALRYQVNPHFLFNTLNSLSSLIMARREDEAESMIMNLSNFFRATLATDPTADVSLSEEIALQRLYLDIEKARFPKRLQVEVEIPDKLQSARLPALLLQPVVENAIKYGVARARDAVTLSIRAVEEDGKLRLTIENDGAELGADAAQGDGSSTGVGLDNVSQRLAARFGAAASCEFGPRPGGGFRVMLSMPLVTNG
jgi:hypothetical protein